MPWVVNVSGERTLMTTLGLRQRTRKLRNKLNKIEPSTSSDRLMKFIADPPNRRPSAAVARGEFFSSLAQRRILDRSALRSTFSPEEDGADADHDR